MSSTDGIERHEQVGRHDEDPRTPEQLREQQGPPASDDAQQQQQQQEEEEEEGEKDDPGTSSFRRKIQRPSAPVYVSDTGMEYMVPQDIREAVDAFRAPDGYECAGDREQSFIYSMGNYVQPIDFTSPLKPMYFCQSSDNCREARHEIPCTRGSRSNVNKHLQKVHGIRGSVGQARAVAAAVQGVKVSPETPAKASKTPDKANKKALAAVGSGRTGTRVLEQAFVMMVVEHMLPFSFASDGETSFKRLAGAMCSGFPSLSARRVKHLVVEMYDATKKVVVGNMAEEVKIADLPIVHYMLDLWACKVSGKKYLSIHVFFVDQSFTLRHALLSVKHYAPETELESHKASEVLLKVFESTLGEFGLTLSDLASGTTDSVSEMEAMCVNGLVPLGIAWDWCMCHAASKASEHAFGTNANPALSMNKPARELLEVVTRVVQRLSKIPAMRKKFDDLQMELVQELFKASEHSPQRWMVLTRVLERIIRQWNPIRELYTNVGEVFPLERGDNREGILQLYSLLQPLSAVTGDGQYSGVPMTAEMHMAFAVLKMRVLDPTKPLKVFMPPERGEGCRKFRGPHVEPLKHRIVNASRLLQTTTVTRKLLNSALVSRVYSRIWDSDTPDPSVFRDAAVLLTPPFNEGKHLQGLRLLGSDADARPPSSRANAPTSDGDLKAKLDGVWGLIETRAVLAESRRQKRVSVEEPGQGPAKRPRQSASKAASPSSSSSRRADDGEDMFAFFGHHSSGGAEEEEEEEQDEVATTVAEELGRYKTLVVETSEVRPSEVLQYWKVTGKDDFPTLRSVAQQVFGNQAAAAKVDRDFSDAGKLLDAPRSRVDTYWVEMMMFLKANYNKIPLTIPKIPPADIRKYLPSRFSGNDPHLAEAENVVDPVGNSLPNAEGGMMGLKTGE